jgi:Fungal specific transcription factor domain/Fungal Zn(2)-Cys(6) binuclear cluster domain
MDGPPSAKLMRLSMACNECRRRKVKCDADNPRCRHCRLRNNICFTTDPKRGGIPVTREWVEKLEQPQATSGVTLNQRHENGLRFPSGPKTTKASTPSATGVAAVAGVTSETTGISPLQQPYDMSFNTDYGTNRIKMMGGSSSQCLAKSLDVYLKSAHVQPLSNDFRHGMRHSEEMTIPLTISLPAIPNRQSCDFYLASFFDKIHPLYPVFNIDEFKNNVRQLASVSDLRSLPHEQIPILASTYLVLSLGVDEESQQLTEDGLKYLHAAAILLGQVILIPYLPAVQTLLLFTLNYRGRNKDGVGWQTLGMAIRIALTLGLHRHSAIRPSDQHGVQRRGEQLFHARIWAICCCLEKIMQLESGRPSMIETVDCDQMMGRDQHPPGHGHDFLQWHMGLAQFQNHISQHIYGHRIGDRTSRQILSDTGRLDRSLLSWASQIPPEFRPGNDLFCPNHEFHIAAFLSIQYYQTMIALHRAALISPAANFELEVTNNCSDDPSQFRLRGGEAICVNSARSIAKLTIEISDRNVESRILTATPSLLACIVLAISLMKNPGSRMQSTDLQASH